MSPGGLAQAQRVAPDRVAAMEDRHEVVNGAHAGAAAASAKRRSCPAPAGDLLDGHSVHAETWELLLGRVGFVDVAHLTAGAGQDRRFALAAAAPA